MNDVTFFRTLRKSQRKHPSSLLLDHGSRVAVIGGGPAGALFAFFLLDMAERINLKIHVDIYEPRDYTSTGPAGCNMCGGVIYESLVQSLAVEGINLPTAVVQRGIECNMLHLDIGSVRIQTPLHEKRIATTFRGAGPRGTIETNSIGLDGYLLQVAVAKGARHVSSRVSSVDWLDEENPANSKDRLFQITPKGAVAQTYELVAVTSGVNTTLLQQLCELEFGYQPPKTSKLLVREYYLGEDVVSNYIGHVFHGFLLDIPGLDYGAIIPKGQFVTICLLSSHGDLKTEMMEKFLESPAVKKIMPPNFSAQEPTCSCGPRINVMGCSQPFGNRIVFIGDCGVSRLYKDGIGGAYRASKVAASTAIFQGVSEEDFQEHYLPFCRRVENDNRIGKIIFRFISQIQRMKFARRAVLQMVIDEQLDQADSEHGMSFLMWDMLTGGAPYREVLKRAIHPTFLGRLLWNNIVALIFPSNYLKYEEIPLRSKPQIDPFSSLMEENAMSLGDLGKVYQNGEVIVRQGETGDCMYVVQDGYVEVIFESEEQEVQLNILGKNEFFGEMAVFNKEVRTATVRALGPARVLTVDHKNLLRCIHEDPSLAYQLMEEMSKRIDKLSEAVAELSQNKVK